MRALEFVTETWGVEKFAIPLPIGDYLAGGSDEFAPPGNYKSAEDLHDEVYDQIDAGVEPQVVTVDPRTLLATQDWLSNAGGDDPLFDEYPDRPVVYQKAGKLYILDGHHRSTRAWRAGRPIAVYLFSDKNLREDVYGVLDSYQCGPFDGGCVLVAQALQKIHGGNIVVLADQNDQAQHAAVAVNGQLMDYSGAADPAQFVRKFEADERVKIANVRPIQSGDLPDAPSNDGQVIDKLVQVLSENSDDSRINPKKLEILGHLKTMPLTVFGSTATKSLRDANDFDVFLDLDATPEHKKYVKPVLNLSYRYYGWIDPFVIKDGVLYVRNDTATGWTRAKNAQAILKNIRAQGRPIDQITENLANNQSWKSQVVDAIKTALPVAQEIWFHGSRATGKHRRNSDTDILVVVPDDVVGDDYLRVVRTLQKVSTQFDNYDIQPTKAGHNIHLVAQEEGQLLWSDQQGVTENFADGKVKGKSRPGRVKRAGASCNGSVTDLRARAKKASGERAKMYHWCANMKSGNKKK